MSVENELPKEPTQEHLIERKSPQVLVRLMAREAILTYFNTRLYMFSEDYEDFNHIYLSDEKQQINPTFLFHSDELMGQLSEQGFTTTTAVYPDDVDVQVYIQYQSELMDRELRELGENDE